MGQPKVNSHLTSTGTYHLDDDAIGKMLADARKKMEKDPAFIKATHLGKHKPQAPTLTYNGNVRMFAHVSSFRGPFAATTGKTKEQISSPQPGLTMSYVRNPGSKGVEAKAVPVAEFKGARVVHGKSEVYELIGQGKLSPFSKVAYRDLQGRFHTGQASDANFMKKMPS
ncbi:MAG: hypothetical protein U1F57_11560 [bacterium]